MFHALGRGTSPAGVLPRPTGKASIRGLVRHHALQAPSVLSDDAPWDADSACSIERSKPVRVEQLGQPLRPNAGRITPAKLAGLSEVFYVPIIRVDAIMQRSPPAVQQLEPQEVAKRLQQLCAELGIRPKQAAFMAAKQPGYMLLTPLAAIRAKVQELADALGVPPAAVLRTALTVPSILRRKTATVQRRVASYSALLSCTPLDVLHVMARGPEYLSHTPSSVRQRMIALGLVLRRPRCTIAAMLQARPDLVGMSAKVMNTKVRGLMCILNKEKRHVVTLLVKLPALLRCDLDRARAVFGGLQALLRKREGFAYAMICHAPQLLLLPPRGLHLRCSALRRCLAASPEWVEQFAQLRPPGVAQLLLNRRGCLSAMMYLCERRRAGGATLEQLLAHPPAGGPAAALGDAWPDFSQWMEWRRRLMVARMRQRRAAVPQAIAVSRRGAVPGPSPQPAPGQAIQQARPTPPVLPLPQPHAAGPLPAIAAVAAVAAVAAAAAAKAGRASSPASDAATASDGQLGLRTLPKHSQAADSAAEASSTTAPVGQAPGPEAAVPSASGQGARPTCNSSRADSHSSASSSVGGSGEADGDLGSALDRSQQPGASSSGIQSTWLQLQAAYRRSLQSRARRKPPEPRGCPAAAAAAAVTARPAELQTSPPLEAASAPPRGAAAGSVAGLAVAAGKGKAARAAMPRRASRDRAAVRGIGWTGDSPAEIAAPSQAGKPNAQAQARVGGSSASQQGNGTAMQIREQIGPAGPTGQHVRQQPQQRHVLSSLLRPMRGSSQQPLQPLEQASTSGNGDGALGPRDRGGDGASGVVALQASAHHACMDGHSLQRHEAADAWLEPELRAGASGGATVCVASSSVELGPGDPGVHSRGGSGGGRATHMPLWLHLQRPANANGDGADAVANGLPGHTVVAAGGHSAAGNVGSGQEELQVARPSTTASQQPDAPFGAREDRECSSSVVVVSEDGFMHEIATLDREACKQEQRGRGRQRSQDRGSQPASAQAHALEHALGVVSPR